MFNSPHHQMAKWLATMLKPVDLYSVYTVRDTFEFCEELEKICEEHGAELRKLVYGCP